MSESTGDGADAGRHQARRGYWQQRFRMMYYRYVYEIVSCVAPDARSILDVGSHACPYLEEFEWIERRVSVDLKTPYSSANVTGIRKDFLKYQPEDRFDVVLCLQVLEHLPEPDPFMKKLFETGSHVVISVPYKWPENMSRWHLHDPVDGRKVQAWAGRKPNYQVVVKELSNSVKSRRLVAYYDVDVPQRRFNRAALLAARESAEPAAPTG